MEKKSNAQEFSDLLRRQGITTLYHFTDRDNLARIIKMGGLYSWDYCRRNGMDIPKPGSSNLSKSLDSQKNIENYVHTSFVQQHPMMYVAMQEGRITNPVLLEISTEVVEWTDTMFSDCNAARKGANIGNSLSDLQAIHFKSLMARKHFDLAPEERPFFQAEVMVYEHIPLEYITNISSFGIPIPDRPQLLQSRPSYTAQISRENPTAFIFLVDQSASMNSMTYFGGEPMKMATALERIVNQQINELILRCVKNDEVRHYFDIAVIGYGRTVQSGWKGVLKGRDFVTPAELKENPYKKIIVKEEKRNRRGTFMTEVEKNQWIEATYGGNTPMNKAFCHAKRLIEEWLEQHKGKVSYPPTIINITDGMFNDADNEQMIQTANELKALSTLDGNVLLFNLHITSNTSESVIFPIDKNEVNGYGRILYDMSSMLPLRYNDSISAIRTDAKESETRHVAMSVNAEMTTLIQLMDIGTPTNISNNEKE